MKPETTIMTHRAALAGTAALPALALATPAATETDDPAIAAVRRWVAADEAERAHHYTGDDDVTDDPARGPRGRSRPLTSGDGPDRPDDR